DAAARDAAGDFARDVLVQIHDRSRLAVDPPVGGWDRDISTSEEIVNAATAYDLLLGAGYDLGADRAEIVRRLASVTDELRTNFVDLSTAGGVAQLHQNNHRTKSGAAMAVAAVALGGDVDDELARRWWDTGVDLVDDVQRHVLITGDGAYAEGPFYYRFTLQNLLPFLDAWERHLGTGSWTTADGLTVPFLGDRPQFARTQRWMLDLTLPDGTLAPIDDGNPGRSSYFGALPSTLPTAAAGYWRWADTPQPLETDGNVDLGPEAIVAYDLALAPAPPTWAPTQFYVEGGNAVFRSAWSDDATMALVLGEHDTASEFGRDRTGAGRYPQSHEHAEPGAFLLEAFGERLALDPGYLSFSEHDEVNRPEHHNVVLVDGAGPADYLDASFAWADDPFGRPPAEGQATIAATLDSGSLDAATVATAYRGATIARRFLFGDDRYLVVADAIDADPGIELTWMVHGNGGGTSGGTFEATATGGRWTIGGGRLDAAIASTAGTP
ncbi:MAG: heparinase II/III family protein, partial [Acidimicrobiales bacterium]|nr:heparinase II/III family protein [Acidimicrobiales bacterium]